MMMQPTVRAMLLAGALLGANLNVFSVGAAYHF